MRHGGAAYLGGFNLFPFNPFGTFAFAASAAPAEVPPAASIGYSQDMILGSAGSDLVDATIYNPYWATYGSWRVFAGAGDDLIASGPTFNAIDGGAGFDIVWYNVAYGVAVDLATSSAVAGSLQDSLFGIEGLAGGTNGDHLAGDGRGNIFFGGQGADRLIGRGGQDILVGGPGTDVYAGGAGTDVFGYGPAWEMAGDRITDFTAEDLILVSGVRLGQDQMQTVPTRDGSVLRLDTDFDGRGDADIALPGVWGGRFLAAPSGAGATAATGIALLPGPTRGDDVLIGMANAESFHGGSGSDMIHGAAGADRLTGGGGNDLIVGGLGRNVLDGGEGRDLLVGDVHRDRYIGGSGGDVIAGAPALLAGDTFADFGPQDVILFAGTRFASDRIFTEAVAGGVRLWCDTDGDGVAETSAVFEGKGGRFVAVPNDNDQPAATYIARVPAATAAADFLTGMAGGDVLRGLGGDDTVLGFGGNDRLLGGNGDDILFGGRGRDRLESGAGSDLLLGTAEFLHGDRITDLAWDDVIAIGGARFESEDVSLERRAGGSILRIDSNENGRVDTRVSLPGIKRGEFIAYASAPGDDAVTILVYAAPATRGSDGLWGTPGRDAINGLAGDDVVLAGTGRDNVQGREGEDILIGGDGADRLSGDAGDDVLAGIGGADTHVGGAGADWFFGNLAGLNRDLVVDFKANDALVVSGLRLGSSALSVDAVRGGIRLHIDSKGNSAPEATVTLRGRFDGDSVAVKSDRGDSPYTLIEFAPDGGRAGARLAASSAGLAPLEAFEDSALGLSGEALGRGGYDWISAGIDWV